LAQVVKGLGGALLAFGLLPLHLYQLTLNLLQLAYLSGKCMAALTALLSLASHCSEALGAYLDAGGCGAVTLG
jgi:hypothetical protein